MAFVNLAFKSPKELVEYLQRKELSFTQEHFSRWLLNSDSKTVDTVGRSNDPEYPGVPTFAVFQNDVAEDKYVIIANPDMPIDYTTVFPLLYLCFTNDSEHQLGYVGAIFDGVWKLKSSESYQMNKFYFQEQPDICGHYIVLAPSRGGKSTFLRALISREPEVFGDQIRVIGESLKNSRPSSYIGWCDYMIKKGLGQLIDSLKDLAFLKGQLGRGGIPNEFYFILSKIDTYCRLFNKTIISIVNPLTLGGSEEDLAPFKTAVEGNAHGVFFPSVDKSSNELKAIFRAQDGGKRTDISLVFKIDDIPTAEFSELRKISNLFDTNEIEESFEGDEYFDQDDKVVDPNNTKGYSDITSAINGYSYMRQNANSMLDDDDESGEE